MPDRVLHILRRIWRGAWRPLPLPPNPRWYDHVGYWPRRLRDVIAATLLFIMPPALAFLVYENFARKPLATVGLATLVGAVWVFAAAMAYWHGNNK